MEQAYKGIVRDWADEESRAGLSRVLKFRFCLEREVESLKNIKQRHDLEGSSSSVSCF